MSQRRRTPTPVQPGMAVGGSADPNFTPPRPQPLNVPPVDPALIMASTNPAEMPGGMPTGPTEFPAPPPGPGVDGAGRLVGEAFPPVGDELDRETLSPEEQVNFASLMTCGRRSKTLHILDHAVVVESLCGSDDLRIGVYAKPFAGTVGEQRAYQIAVAAAAIRSIDGKPIVPNLFENPDEDVLFDQKIKVVEKMYPTVISAIYKGALTVEREFLELVEQLGKSFG